MNVNRACSYYRFFSAVAWTRPCEYQFLYISPRSLWLFDRAVFYDELPEDSWRDLYCEYVGIDRTVMEHIMLTAVGDLHFILRDIEKPTPEELKEIIAEVEQMVNDSEELET